MLGLFRTPRRALIVAHDLFMTAAAVIASFYIRFEAVGLLERRHTLFTFLPAFVVYAGLRLFLFSSLQIEVAFRLAARPDEHPARGDRAGGVAVGARLRAGRAERARAVLLRQNHDRAVLVTPDRLPERIAHRLSLFPLYADADNTPARRNRIRRLVLGRAADAEVLLRAIESGAVKRIWPVGILSPSDADRGQSIRGIPVLGKIDDARPHRRRSRAARHARLRA